MLANILLKTILHSTYDVNKEFLNVLRFSQQKSTFFLCQSANIDEQLAIHMFDVSQQPEAASGRSQRLPSFSHVS